MGDGARDGDETDLSYRTDDSSRFRRPWSRVCHCLLGILFFLMMAVSLVALGLFAAKHNKIAGEVKHTGGDDNCILYTSKDDLQSSTPRLSSGVGCRFTIWGCGIVAMAAGAFMLGFLFKTVYGSSVSSCLVCVELPLLLVLLVTSLSVSINTSIGLALACKAFNDANENDSFFKASGSECKDYSVGKGTKFFEDMVTSGIMSWSVTGALVLVVALYIALNMVFWRKCTSSDDEAGQALLDKTEPDKKKKKKKEKEKKEKARPKMKHSATDSNNPFL